MSRIDILVPAYNATESLPRTLGNIASQSIANDVDVTIVDDRSVESYWDIARSSRAI